MRRQLPERRDRVAEPTAEREPMAARGGSPDVAAILALQRSAGNSVVQRYLAGGAGRTQPPRDVGGAAVAERLERNAGSGSELEGGIRSDIESSFGVSLSRVRVHTGTEATQLARSVDAVAFTYGQDIYFRDGAYDPRSTSGRELIAHEATHTLQQASGGVSGTSVDDGVAVSTPGDRFERAADHAATAFSRGDRVAARLSLEPTVRGIQRITDEDLAMRHEGAEGASGSASAGGSRVLSWLTMKRKHISLKGEDKYGHWWTEMDGTESYGWWPKYPVSGLWDTLTGVEGELNGQTSFGGGPTTDPHHGDTAEEAFNPEYSGSLTDTQIKDEVRKHATGYSGEWRWTFGWGQNCHTFQKAMMAKIGLREP